MVSCRSFTGRGVFAWMLAQKLATSRKHPRYRRTIKKGVLPAHRGRALWGVLRAFRIISRHLRQSGMCGMPAARSVALHLPARDLRKMFCQISTIVHFTTITDSVSENA